MIYKFCVHIIYSCLSLNCYVAFADDWWVEGDKGVTTLHFWMNYRIGNSYIADEDFKSGLEYIDRALTLIPPLREGEMPHQCEVLARVFRAKALEEMGGVSSAIAEYRICLAAIRLLDHHGKVDMNDTKHMLIGKMRNFTSILLGLIVEQKIMEGASRPYFSHDERLDLMKELGFGLYSDNGLKCSCCGKTDSELAKKKLVLCANCKGCGTAEENVKRRHGRMVIASLVESCKRSMCHGYHLRNSNLVGFVCFAKSMILPSLFY